MSPVISVILPVYNAEKFITDAVESILSQTFTDFELIIINDASTDTTAELLATITDDRIRVITNRQNMKVVKCLNTGLEHARGSYIARMDADDISMPDRFEKQMAYFKAHPNVDLCGSHVAVFGDDEFIFRPYENHDDIKAAFLFLNIMIHPSVIFKKEKFTAHGFYYDEKYVNAEDYGLWIKAIDHVTFANVPEVLIRYRFHGQNVSVVGSGSNWEVLKEMNSLAYTAQFKKIGVPYSDEELEMHINLGFNRIKEFNTEKYFKYLHWLKKIVAANQKSNYYAGASLRNQVLHKLIFLTKNIRMNTASSWALIRTLTTMFGITDYLKFIKYRSENIKKLKK